MQEARAATANFFQISLSLIHLTEKYWKYPPSSPKWENLFGATGKVAELEFQISA